VHIIRLRRRGLSYEQIASSLNAKHVPTPLGGSRWLKSHVDRLLHTQWVRVIIEELDDR
jgi:Recombinase